MEDTVMNMAPRRMSVGGGRGRLVGAAAAALVAILALSGCTAAAAGSGDASTGTRTVQGAYGAVQLPISPTRVVATDNPSLVTSLDVGITPVGGSGKDYFKTNLSPKYWSKIAGITEVGGTKIDPDKVASVNPDVIIGVQAYISKSMYKTLSKIAPVYVLKDEDAPWQVIAEEFANALNRSDRVVSLKKAYDSRVTALASKYKDVLSSNTWESIYTWDSGWAREAPVGSGVNGARNDLATLKAMGAKLSSATIKPGGAGTYWQNESFEQLDALKDADVILSEGNSPQITALPAWKDLPAVKNERVGVSDYLIPNGYSVANSFLDDVEKILKQLQKAS